MKHRVKSAFFCVKYDPSIPIGQPQQLLTSIRSRPGTTPVDIVVDLVGPPNQGDKATLGLLLPDGRSATVGPDYFTFNHEGKVRLVFHFEIMPLDVVGSASAQILFDGESTAAPICGLGILPPSSAGDLTIH